MNHEEEIYMDLVLGSCREEAWHSVGVIVENVLTKINGRLWAIAVESRWINQVRGEVTVRFNHIVSPVFIDDFMTAAAKLCTLHGVPFRREERGLGDGPGTAGIPKDPVIGPPKGPKLSGHASFPELEAESFPV